MNILAKTNNHITINKKSKNIVYSPLCSGIFPLSGAIFMIYEIHLAVRLYSFLPAGGKRPKWIFFIGHQRATHCGGDRSLAARLHHKRNQYNNYNDFHRVLASNKFFLKSIKFNNILMGK